MTTLVYDNREYDVGAGIIIGRHSDCGLRVYDHAASRKHARVFSDPDSVAWLENLSAANGTRLNGKRITGRMRLADDDCIAIGHTRILVQGTQHVRPAGDPFATSEVGAVAAGAERDAGDLAGTTIGGYHLGEVIGRGGMGVVYRARQTSLGREVALKVFNPELVRDTGDFGKRFLGEARLAAKIEHDGVVVVHDCGQNGEWLWYSMELVAGRTLDAMLKKDGPFDPMQAVLVAERVAATLTAAHAKEIIHQDVKPANLMLNDQGVVKLLDLGLAEVLHHGRRTRRRKVVAGSPYYLSPEQARGKPADARGDIYSLGCTLYQMLTGRPPYTGKSANEIIANHINQPTPKVRALLPELPTAIDDLLQGMMNKNPEWRHATMGEVTAELKALREKMQAAPVKVAKIPRPARAATVAAVDEVDDDIDEDDGSITDRITFKTRHPIQIWMRRLVWTLVLVLVGSYVMSSSWFSDGRRALREYLAAREAAATNGADRTGASGDPAAAEIVAKPVSDPAGERWQVVSALVDREQTAGNWRAAEHALRDLLQAFPAAPQTDSARARLSQLLLDGEAWYRQRLSAIPPLNQPVAYAQSLAQLDRLRDVVLTDNAADADARYQEVLSRLTQQMQVARRKARLELEGGHADRLPALAQPLAPAFTGTPVVGLYRHFDAQCSEAARSQGQWKGTWSSTKDAMRAVSGEMALAAGAALMLAEESDSARHLLLGDKQLAQGALLKRREALFGREAAVLGFKDPGDLQYIESLTGDVRLENGTLTATAGEAVAFACTVPVGGANWEVVVTAQMVDNVRAGPEGGQFTVACAHHEGSGDQESLQIRIERHSASVRVHTSKAWQQSQPERPATNPVRIRVTCRAGKLAVMFNNQSVFECADANVPPGSQVRLYCTGLTWQLDGLHVVGGE